MVTVRSTWIGMRGLEDRLSAVGGRLAMESPPLGGTRLVAELPCA
jgi:signal transduction histidine kinase